MLGTQNLPVFIITGTLLNLAPGQDTMYILSRGIWQGRKAAIVSALGISSGSVIHTLAAALGLSAILATSMVAFTIVKWVGAGYLVYLGIRILVTRSKLNAPSAQSANTRLGTIYRQAILTNVLNPKVALFFIAFLPQFVDPATPHRVLTFLFLGACFIFNGTLWCLVLALASGSLNNAIQRRPRVVQTVEKMTGGFFMFLGAKLTLSRR